LDKTGILLTILELSVALAGFSGIVSAYQFRSDALITRGNATGLFIILNFSFSAAFTAALPLAMLNFDIENNIVWTATSVAVATCLIYHAIFIMSNQKKIDVSNSVTRVIFGSIYVGAILLALVNLMNALNIVFKREFGPIFIGQLYGLGVTCMAFARLTLRPIWKLIKKKEAENQNSFKNQ
jgi:hypothetical protein